MGREKKLGAINKPLAAEWRAAGQKIKALPPAVYILWDIK